MTERDGTIRNGATGGPIRVRIDLARGRLADGQARQLDAGCVVELDTRPDEPVELYAGGELLARGEAVVVDGKLGVRVRQIVAGARRTE
ncbi:MAG TPA: FliM/FliN family flagellar motor switch protein [Phycisphaerae bacterium]|nr:FliM/FliN family flagellar motor switch protein [Phycisphaerae bacterium]